MAQGFRRSNNQRSRAAKSIRPNALSVSAKAEYPPSQPQRELPFRAKVPFHTPQAMTAIRPPARSKLCTISPAISSEASSAHSSATVPMDDPLRNRVRALSDRSTTQLFRPASQTAQGSSGRPAGQFRKTWRNRPRRLIMNMQALLFRQKRRGAFDAARRALRPLRPLDGHVFGPAV